MLPFEALPLTARNNMKAAQVFAAFFAGMLCAAGGAWSQAYPAKPARVIVPFPPGEANDIVSRIVFPKLSEPMGQQFIIDNRAGAGGTFGSAVVAQSAPDGYTLLIHTGASARAARRVGLMGSDAPNLTVAPGMKIADVVERSPAIKFFHVPADDEKRAIAQPQDPHRVSLLIPDIEHGFTLPAGLLSFVDCTFGVVYQITTNPQIGFLDEKGTNVLRVTIVNMMKRTKWTPTAEPEPMPTEEDSAKTAGAWKRGAWVAELEVKLMHEAGPMMEAVGIKGPAYLSTLTIRDEDLTRRAFQP